MRGAFAVRPWHADVVLLEQPEQPVPAAYHAEAFAPFLPLAAFHDQLPPALDPYQLACDPSVLAFPAPALELVLYQAQDALALQLYAFRGLHPQASSGLHFQAHPASPVLRVACAAEQQGRLDRPPDQRAGASEMPAPPDVPCDESARSASIATSLSHRAVVVPAALLSDVTREFAPQALYLDFFVPHPPIFDFALASFVQVQAASL